MLAGIHPAAAMLGSARVQQEPGLIERIVVAEECRNPRVLELLDVAESLHLAIERQPREQLDQLADGVRHQDILLLARPHNLHEETALAGLLQQISGEPLILVLDGVQDPHNLGACLRTAEAAGVHLVVIPRDRAVGLTAVVRRAAAGAAETLDIVQVTNLARVLRQLKPSGIWLAGTADDASESLYQADLRGPLALVLGSEGQGMRRLTAEHCDYLLSIPMAGGVSSLNVSVAAGVCLFEVVRQRTSE